MTSFFNQITDTINHGVNDDDDINQLEDLQPDNEDGSGDESADEQDVVQAKRGKRHAKLLESIKSLDKNKRQRITQRSEPNEEVSEFNLNDQDGDSQGIKMHELIRSLAPTPSHSALKKQLSNLQRNQKVLDTPLHKHQADKVRRSGAYDAVAQEVSRWDQVVQTNRRAEHLSFPLDQPAINIQTTDEFVKKFKPSTPLEQEVYALLNASKHRERPDKELTVAEEEALAAMSLEEAKERRAELQKTRALLSYYEAKCHRKKKIKSKTYHRIERKQKSKQQTRQLEENLSKNPEAAEEQLVQLDKARAKERVTLKHRNTGKWAKGIVRFGKYDQNARNLIAEQLQKSRDLTKKIAEVNNDDEEAQEELPDDDSTKLSLSDVNNPWFFATVADKQQQQDDVNVDKTTIVPLEPVVGHIAHEESESEDDDENDDDDDDDDADNEQEVAMVTPTINKTIEFDLSHIQSENPTHQTRPARKDTRKSGHSLQAMMSKQPTVVESTISPELVIDEVQPDADGQHLMNIQEAFAEDDVVRVFQEEKQERVDRDKPQDVDLSLPGWGTWGGSGIQQGKRRKKRFVVKAEPAPPRRDENLQHVLINENRDKKVAVHQVRELPFPFRTADQFERSVRSPIGATWNTPSTVRQLTAPKVTTKMGAIIEPITAVEAFKQKKKRFVEIDGDKVETDIPFDKKRKRNDRKTKKGGKKCK